MARAQKDANRQLKMKLKGKSMEPSEPVLTTSVESSPGAWSEPVTPPVTVSAANSAAEETGNQSAQP